jgi:3-methyladenine DNA glycosylase AlkD
LNAGAVTEIRAELRQLGSERKARFLQKFFKTGPGEYGEGDIFLGIGVPELRKLAIRYQSLPAPKVLRLLRSPIHEERLLALLILVRCFTRADDSAKKQIYDVYLDNTKYINNWDLVDVSAPRIVGTFLMAKNKEPLYTLAKSKNLWARRISVIATAYFITQNQFSDTLEIAKILLTDKEDLIHKAVGWMLREVGKRDISREEYFLKQYYKRMPRTMLRYAIERFSESRRRAYLAGQI